ncbi:MAG: hypothetical protein AB7U82_19900 [Blastocatellales bacterium]
MKTRFCSAITAAAILLCCAALAVTTPAQHEGHGARKPPAQERQDKRTEMTPNHLLAMAYLQNMAIFAKLLRDQVQQNNAVNGAFARDVTAELRRGFDQVELYQQRHMGITQANAPVEYKALREIGADRGAITPPSPAIQPAIQNDKISQPRGQTMETMRRMEACMMRLSIHLIELERETGAANPNPKWVLEQTNAIIRILDEISAMQGGSQAASQ